VGGSRLTQEQKDRKFAKVRGLDVDWFMGLSRKDRRFIKDQQARVKAAKIGRRWNVEFTDGREEESNHFDLLPISVGSDEASSPEEALAVAMKEAKARGDVLPHRSWIYKKALIYKGLKRKATVALSPEDWAKANPATPTAMQVGGIAAIGFTAWRFYQKHQLRQQLLASGFSEADAEQIIADNFSFFSFQTAASLLKGMSTL
jgi:hypothetical protein